MSYFKEHGIELPSIEEADSQTNPLAIAHFSNGEWDWFVIGGKAIDNGDVYLYGLVNGYVKELGMFTLILSHIAFSIPFVIVSVRSTLNYQIETLEEAAKDLGANDTNIFFKIILPLIKPGVISGATLAFTLSLDDVVISYFTAGPGSNTLPLKIYGMIKTGITPDVNALSSLMLLVTIIILTLSAFRQTKKLGESYEK